LIGGLLSFFFAQTCRDEPFLFSRAEFPLGHAVSP
jgi:hypothetical protein